MEALLISANQVQFTDDTEFSMTVKKLDDNNNWETLFTSSTPATINTYTMANDGIYHFILSDGSEYGHLIYEDIKLKLRTYAKEQLCKCCESDCAPCDNERVYDFTMLVHLSLAYLGNNEYILDDAFDPDDTELERINNAIVRTQKYILSNDL